MIRSSAIPCGTFLDLSHKKSGERITARKRASRKGTTITDAVLTPASTITTAAMTSMP